MKTDIFGVLFDNYTISEAIQKSIDSLGDNKPFVIATPNPEIVEVARKDAEYKNIINSSDIVTPDGIGIVYASKFVKGDATVPCIAAASILAKVSRDRMCDEYDKEYPEYGFAKHKGYGTKAHMDAIREFGPCPVHRRSFLKFLDK